jgi:hypothetical protein
MVMALVAAGSMTVCVALAGTVRIAEQVREAVPPADARALSRPGPDAQRCWGDGGCDAWIEDIRRAAEYKSFTKLGNTQRKQVTKSLRRAAEKNPASWVLVAPVLPTPGDLQWFASLKDRYRSIEMSFRDVRWLELQLANHPDIARYLLTTPHQEVIDMLRELREEQAGLLGGAPDLRGRVTALRHRAACR